MTPLEALNQIRDILRPSEDPDQQWTPDTLDQIAEIVIAFDESAKHKEAE